MLLSISELSEMYELPAQTLRCYHYEGRRAVLSPRGASAG